MAQQDVFKSKMFVIKRNGQKQEVHFDKITARIGKLAYGLNADFCDPVSSIINAQGGSSFSILIFFIVESYVEELNLLLG